MARYLDVSYDRVFEPWPLEDIRGFIARYRAAMDGGTVGALRESADAQEFEKHHPRLSRLLYDPRVHADPRLSRLIDELVDVRARAERGDVTPEAADEQVNRRLIAEFTGE